MPFTRDRMQGVKLTDECFELPEGFSPQEYFSEYYGVMTTDEPLTHMVVRAHCWTPNYLRTLPLHHSQREIASTDQYADFALDLRPTADFQGQLLSHGARIEVLEPESLRQQMKQLLTATLEKYM